MPRSILEEAQIHPSVRAQVALHESAIVQAVRSAVATHPVVVVGMKTNPFPLRARKALAAAGLPCHYLEYGSYLGQWRPRTALKMWSGWPTYPMVFIQGQLVGGAQDLQRLIASGEAARLVASAAPAA
jgi:monothiol glutaredoxin